MDDIVTIEERTEPEGESLEGLGNTLQGTHRVHATLWRRSHQGFVLDTSPLDQFTGNVGDVEAHPNQEAGDEVAPPPGVGDEEVEEADPQGLLEEIGETAGATPPGTPDLPEVGPLPPELEPFLETYGEVEEKEEGEEELVEVEADDQEHMITGTPVSFSAQPTPRAPTSTTMPLRSSREPIDGGPNQFIKSVQGNF